MTRRQQLLLVFPFLLVAAGAARAASIPDAGGSHFSRPVIGGKNLAMAQIGGTSGKPKDEPSAPMPGGKQVVNPTRAMLYSLILPGLGQQAAGRPERARVFYAIEAGIWTSFAVFRVQGDERKDRYIDYAEFTAGVNSSGKNDDYWRTISQYQRSDPGPGSANEYVRRQARALYPDDYSAQQAYLEQHGYFDDNSWDWQNADNLAKYQDLRSSSIDSYDRSQFSLFAAIADRVVSVIDANRVAHQANRAAAQPNGDTGSSGLNPLDHLGFRMQKNGDDRVPMVTWKMNF